MLTMTAVVAAYWLGFWNGDSIADYHLKYGSLRWRASEIIPVAAFVVTAWLLVAWVIVGVRAIL